MFYKEYGKYFESDIQKHCITLIQKIIVHVYWASTKITVNTIKKLLKKKSN